MSCPYDLLTRIDGCSGLLAGSPHPLPPLSAHRVQAQTAPLPQLQSADPFVADLFRRSGSTGMVVVVVRDNETWMQSYGQTYPGSHQKPER